MSAPAHWSHRPEGGGWFAIWLIRTIGLHFGRGFARLFLYPITLYFYVRRPFERRMSRAFLQRAYGRPAHAHEVLRHIHRFASTILDSVFLLAGQLARFDIRVHGLEELTSRMRPQRGVLLLGAHVGSFDVLRVLAARHPGVKLRVVLDKLQMPALNTLLHALDPAIERCVIDAALPGPDIALALDEAIREGALAALLADRARAHEATTAVDFFGAPAAFPLAPFALGAALAAPVVLCFGLYRGGNRYDLHFEAFADGIALPRRERAAHARVLAQRFAARLEHHVRQDPYNWFNWHDFWNEDAHEQTLVPAAEPAHPPPPAGEPGAARASVRGGAA